MILSCGYDPQTRDTGDTNGYTATATALLLVDWDDTTRVVTAEPDLVPDDVRPAQFFAVLIDRLLAVTPVSHHVTVREQRERRNIPVREADESGPDASAGRPATA